MAAKGPHVAGKQVEELIAEVSRLADEVCVLRDVIDEVREELQYLNNNGIKRCEPLPTVRVLKRMAADPCAEDWAERLVIDRGQTPTQNAPEVSVDGATEAPAASETVIRETEVDSAFVTPKPPPGKLFTEPGEQSRLF